jgi:predicted metal-dependent peptidase
MTHSRDDPFAVIEAEAARQTAAERASRALSAARARLILGRDARSAFFACLVLRLAPAADWDCETMATDGRALAYHPRFVAGLGPDELVGVLAHEVLHCALAHPGRRGVRDAARWNVACDLAVNPLLVQAGFALPASRLTPGEGTYAHLPPGQSADAYYALLGPVHQPAPSDDVRPGDGDGEKCPGDPGGCGSVTDPVGASPAQIGQTAAQWRVAVAQAEQAARGRGELPAGLDRTADRVLRPPRDWREVLREFVASHARNDHSWARPNRRFLWQGLYLPGLHSEELGDVVVAVDTSGSVGERELGVFAAEVNGILAAFDCAATVLYHDTEVQKVQTWRSGDGELVLDPVGGGGTSHRCVFDWLDRSDLDPSCVVCLTDLETQFPDRVPATPVLWAVAGDATTRPPFGRRVSVGG